MTEEYQQTVEELEQHFKDQLSFIEASAESFDQGNTSEAKRIATAIRVLVHDGVGRSKSKSLLTLLGKKDAKFYDSAQTYVPESIMSYSGLIMTFLSDGHAPTYKPNLDSFNSYLASEKDFDSWWGTTVFVDSSRREFTRKELILSVADQDGGAHVDAKLNHKYADLSRRNSMGDTYTLSGENKASPMGGAEKSAVRQIGHEILKTFIPGYYKELPAEGMMVTGLSMVVGEEARRHAKQMKKINPHPKKSSEKIGRNTICPLCPSQKKFKHCCGASK